MNATLILQFCKAKLRSFYFRLAVVVSVLVLVEFIGVKMIYDRGPIIITTIYCSNGTKPFHQALKVEQRGQVAASNLTIVTQYFQIRNSKHGHASYLKWMDNFFAAINRAPVVIYTDRESYWELEGQLDAAKSASNPKTIYIIDNIWSVFRQLEIDRNKEYIDSYLETQIRLDPEQRQHSPSLYAIWNAKSFFMNHSAHVNLYSSKFFIYTDIGAFREANVYDSWPDLGFVQHMINFLNGRILFGQVNSKLSKPTSSLNNYVEGGFFAGSPEIIKFFASKFYDIHDELFAQNLFIGKDQTMMNIFAKLRHANVSARFRSPYRFLKCLTEDGRWFFYQYYFSHIDSAKDKCIGGRDRFSTFFIVKN